MCYSTSGARQCGQDPVMGDGQVDQVATLQRFDTNLNESALRMVGLVDRGDVPECNQRGLEKRSDQYISI